MTTNEELTSMLMKDDVTTTDDEIDQQLTALCELLKLPPGERQAILAKHAARSTQSISYLVVKR